MSRVKQEPHWALEFHRYRRTVNTHKTHKPHSMPRQYFTFTHIPVHFSKTHSPPHPLSKGQQKVPDHCLNWPGAISQQNTPVLTLINIHNCQHWHKIPFLLVGSWLPWIPQGPNPLFVHRVLGCSNLLSLSGFPATPKSIQPRPLAQRFLNDDWSNFTCWFAPASAS